MDRRIFSIARITHATGCCMLRHILKQWVWSPLLGTARLYIGAHHGVLPAVQAYSGIPTICLTYIIQVLMLWYTHTSWLVLIRNIPIPTLMASLYIVFMQQPSSAWRKVSIAACIPLCGWICFLAHPIHNSVMLYTMYWIIPIICAIYAHRSIMITMLGATFTAHVAGSCMWLITTPLTAEAWNSLIPLVAVERMTCALLMTATYYTCLYTPYVYYTMITYTRAIGKHIYARI